MQIIENNDQDVLNYCTKFLARENDDSRHNFGQFSDNDPRGGISETWRFPIISAYSDGKNFQQNYAFNKVIFIYKQQKALPVKDVYVVGTFANLYEAIPLKKVLFLEEETSYYALSVVIPKGEVHTYKFVVDGQFIVDHINPQRVVLDNGKEWSRFFSELCTHPLSFEKWEFNILERFVNHILPFETEEGNNFLNRYYKFLDSQSKETQYAYAYRLDQSVGAVNFIDNILAREENHHLIDYKLCLAQINQVLRQRNPYVDPEEMDKEIYVQLYQEMATDQVNGWDPKQYSSPLYFLKLLRRHTYTGAFSHPKYGGNVGGSGWAYLSERYRDQQGNTLFDWSKAIEQPLGVNTEYHG